MWYVMQVRTGREEKTIDLIKNNIPFCRKSKFFLPKAERKKRYAGAWHLEREVLFPGYVFVDTDEIEVCYLALKTVPELTKLLGTGELWTPISDEDLGILHRLLNQDYLMKLSQGTIIGNQIRIQSGPLNGMEAVIKKVNRHRRTAVAEIRMFGRNQEIEVGMEILWKGETERRRMGVG